MDLLSKLDIYLDRNITADSILPKKMLALEMRKQSRKTECSQIMKTKMMKEKSKPFKLMKKTQMPTLVNSMMDRVFLKSNTSTEKTPTTLFQNSPITLKLLSQKRQ